MFEFGMGQDFAGAGQDLERHGGVAFLGDEFGGIVGRELVIGQEEKIGGGENVAQEFDAFADERGDGVHFIGGDGKSGGVDDGEQAGAEMVDGEGADVFGVEPEGFGVEGFVGSGGGLFEINDGVGAVDAFEREGFDEFLAGEVFAVVLGRPAEQAQEVDEGFGEESGIAVSSDADDGTVAAFGKFRSIGSDEERKMGELGRVGSGALENKNVFVGVGEVVLAADDVADAEVDIVGAGSEVVGGHAVGAEEGEVFDVGGRFELVAIDGVVEAHCFGGVPGDAEAEGESFSGGGAAVALGAGELAHAGIEEPGLIGAGFFGVSGVSGSEVAIGQSFLKDGVGDMAMEGEALGLFVFFVPAEIEPAQAFEDGVDGGVGIAFDVGVVEAEDHGSSVATSVEPVEDESASAADVEKSGRGRGESDAKHKL